MLMVLCSVNVYLRYKVVVLAGDETEALNFVLLDRPASRIVEQTTTKLISDNLQVGVQQCKTGD